ncbi:MAG: SLC13 family permease, partial [Bacteroidaceae bacterium]
AVVMMVGLFVIGGGILHTGLAKAISRKLMKSAGGNETKMFLLVMIVTSLVGAFVSNTGTVALMMPVAVAMSLENGKGASRLLMPLAFASSMGGMLTLIGTPPNLVIDEVLRENGHPGLSFFSFLPAGAVCLCVGIAVMLPLSRLLDKKKKHGNDKKERTPELLIKEYHVGNSLTAMRTNPRSSIVGKTIKQLNLKERYNINIVEIRTDTSRRHSLIRNVRQSMPTQNTVVAVGDILYLQGSADDIAKFAAEASLTKQKSSGMNFYDIGIAEIIILPQSQLAGRTLRDSGLRKQYHVNVLAIKRGGSHITTNSADTHLKAGDTLLTQGKWGNISKLQNNTDDWILIGRPDDMATKVTLDHRAPIAAAIMVAMIAAMSIDSVPIAPVTAVIAAALLMVLSGCFRSVDAAYKTINWESVVLIASMMPMATALEKTGISAGVSNLLASNLGAMGPTALLCGIYLTTSLLTMFISNTATTVLMAPIALNAATLTGSSPIPFLMGVAFAAGMCFASPFSTPPNALVMQPGNYTFSDYIKVGLPLQIIIGTAMVVALPLLFPF